MTFLKTKWHITLYTVQRVRKRPRHNSGVRSPPKTRKRVHIIYVHKQFLRHNPKAYWPQSFIILSVRAYKSLVYSAPTENGEKLSAVCKTIRSRPKTLERVRQPMVRCVHAFTNVGGDLL